MSLRPRDPGEVPAQTAEVAYLAFPKGCLCMRLREVLGLVFRDEGFASLYPARGKPAWSPAQLALVSILQFTEGLSDRQAAAAVRARIDWKFLLGLELTDAGFDHSLLSEFRDRNISSTDPHRLLDLLLDRMREADLLKRPGQQRTDSTHVLAAVRRLNRLELTAEHLRAALNALAVVAPEWLAATVPANWFDRYERRIENYRLPRGEQERAAYFEQTGQDGMFLLDAVLAPGSWLWLRELPQIQALRICWDQQYVTESGRLRGRTPAEMPPSHQRLESPYDLDARYSIKRGCHWSGYKIHLTEVCDRDAPHLITHVATTVATVTDVEVTEEIHADLEADDLLADAHLVDRGYVSAALLATSQTTHGVELIGPIREDVTWQGHAGQGFDVDSFTIDWENRQATWPEGHKSVRWKPHLGRYGHPESDVFFSTQQCLACPARDRCTRSKTGGRKVTLGPREEHEAIRQARQAQQTDAWKQRYATRAGVEAAFGQGLRRCGLRRTRYRGLDKTGFQHVLTAAALNLIRTDAWLTDTPLATTRTSRFTRIRPV